MTNPTTASNERIQEEWSIGSYPTLARTFLAMAAELVDVADVGPQSRVLDVACGTGNVTLTAYRRGPTSRGWTIHRRCSSKPVSARR